jgi:hypothetical protein
MLRLLCFAAAIATFSLLAGITGYLTTSEKPSVATTGPITIAQACPGGACSGL